MQTNDSADNAGVIAFPPFVLAATLLLGWLLNWLWPISILPGSSGAWPGMALIVVSIVIALTAVRALFKMNTVLDVRKATTSIVSNGPFAISRNPIYLAMIMLCLGIALFFNWFWLLLLAIPFALILQKGVIEREERYLERKFGDEYARYRTQVRRWL